MIKTFYDITYIAPKCDLSELLMIFLTVFGLAKKNIEILICEDLIGTLYPHEHELGFNFVETLLV